MPIRISKKTGSGGDVGTVTGTQKVDVTTGNGHGSTNDKIRRYSTVTTDTGSSITYADSATLGGTVTINNDGIYYIMMRDQRVASAAAF